MTKVNFVVALAVLVPGQLVAQVQVDATDPQAAAIVADCSARKFETSVEIERDGRKRLTRMKLCAATNADDAAWARTLKDAKVKIAANPEITEESKAEIASKLDAEIAKLEPAGIDPAAMPAPLPPVEPRTEFAVTPSLSAPQRVAPAAPKEPIATAAATPAAKAPRLTIKCLVPGEKGGGSNCATLEHNTQLQIRADVDLAPGTSLRFLRRGDLRGELALAPMRQGQLFRARLPKELCAGVASSKVEIQVMGANKLVETLGPYPLRC
jgi:hypothetical protein